MKMKVIKANQVPKEKIESPLFTPGVATMQSFFKAPESDVELFNVNFGKGVRNKFHAHTTDQIIIITSGKGWVATEKEKIPVEPGDVVLFSAGEKHWHGATEDSEFSHLFVRQPGAETTQLEE
jgi:quercetin dioxygenase-like cupin family protein